jgi:RNA polymerase sigma-70 factor (ECF subfamily)
MQSEELLAKACSKGDRAAQRALYDRYCKKMMVICMRYGRSIQEAEDILQESFIKVFGKIKGFRFESKLETWITRIVINTALNHQRQKLYLLPMVDVENITMVQDEEINLSEFHLSELVKMIQSLPDGCRVVFNLFAIEGYSHKEISEELGISIGTSKSQYNRARGLLQSKLKKQEKVYKKYGEASI